MLTALAKLLKALNSEASPGQISMAFVLGMIMGLTPMWSAHNIIVVLLALVLRINLTGFLLAWGLFSGIAYVIDPIFIQAGERILGSPELASFWTSLYQSDAWRVTHFNHTLTMGSLLVSLVAAIPFFFLCNFLIHQYRDKLFAWVQKSKLAQMLKASKLYKIYNALDVRGVSI